MAASSPPSPEPQRLERSTGLGRVLFQSIAAMGPGASVALGLGLIILYSTKAAPLAMLLGAIAALCIATAVGGLAPVDGGRRRRPRRRPSSDRRAVKGRPV